MPAAVRWGAAAARAAPRGQRATRRWLAADPPLLPERERSHDRPKSSDRTTTDAEGSQQEESNFDEGVNPRSLLSPMDSVAPPRPASRLRWWGVGAAAAVVVVAGTLSVLYFVPLTQTATETDFFAMVVPYNASETECTSVEFDHTGTYSFDVHLPIQATGDIFFLTATGPSGQLYRSPGDTHWDGSIPIKDTRVGFHFCLDTNRVSYPAFGGAAAGSGTLTYAHTSPIL